MRWCAIESNTTALLGEAALFTPGYEYCSAIPQLRQAILTALYRDTAFYGDTASYGDTALYGGPVLSPFWGCLQRPPTINAHKNWRQITDILLRKWPLLPLCTFFFFAIFFHWTNPSVPTGVYCNMLCYSSVKQLIFARLFTWSLDKTTV